MLNDGTPIKSVEVKVDDGPWQPATMDPQTTASTRGSSSPTTGTAPRRASTRIVSRVTDVDRRVQPTEQELENKKSFLEDNSQHPRRVMIS